MVSVAFLDAKSNYLDIWKSGKRGTLGSSWAAAAGSPSSVAATGAGFHPGSFLTKSSAV